MPGIEVLPNSTSISAPGWAYVPDTGYDPSKAAIQPSGARKRAARTAGLTDGDTSTRQQNAILRHLAELDKDNPRDIQIPVPARFKDKSGSKKTTPTVRRILMSQKTFANHLADEEAALATQEQQTRSVPTSTPGPTVTGTEPSPSGRRPSTTAVETPLRTGHEISTGISKASSALPVSIAGDENPLMKSYVPPMPSPAVMEALLAGPPLSYNAARSQPPSGKPQRRFCEICGYWGRIKCLKCGARVCGLECKGAHDEGRCLQFYA